MIKFIFGGYAHFLLFDIFLRNAANRMALNQHTRSMGIAMPIL